MNLQSKLGRRWLVSLLAVGLTVGVAGCGHPGAMPHDGPGYPEMGMGPMGPNGAGMPHRHHLQQWSEALKLDAGQQQKLSALLEAMHAHHMGQMAVPMGQGADSPWSTLIGGERFDRAAAQALLEARANRAKQNASALVAAAGDFYDSLQPAQQQTLRDQLNRHRKMR